MKIQDHLDQALGAAEDASLVAFGDLTTGMILKWAARGACPREALDRIGEEAAASFALVDSTAIPEGADPDLFDPGYFGGELVHFTETAAHVFARTPDNDEDVVCIVVAQGVSALPRIREAGLLADTIAEVT